MHRHFLLFLMFSLLYVGCRPDLNIPEESLGNEGDGLLQSPGLFSPNKDYFMFSKNVKLTNFSKAFAGLDLENGNVYLEDDIHNKQHAIDILLFDFKNSTQMNIALPTSRQLSFNVFGEDVQYGWRHKN